MFRSPIIDDDGIWISDQRTFVWTRDRPALFLDRDGVIVEETGFLCRPADVRLIQGAARIIELANRSGIPVIVISNQSGIGRGLFSWDDLAQVQARIVAELAAAGAAIDASLACPHHPEAIAPFAAADSPYRKPNPGMLLKAATMFGLSLAQSWIIGDRPSDMLAGRLAGLRGGLHVATGAGGTASARAEALGVGAGSAFRVHAVGSIAEADAYLPVLKDEGRPPAEAAAMPIRLRPDRN